MTQPGLKARVFVPDTASAYLQFPSFNTSFNGISLSLGATYRVSEKISIKANIARGYRAPSITEFASNGLDPGAHIIYLGNRNFKPEFNLQTDLGADYHDKNINASISIFNNNIHQYIYLSALTDNNGDLIVNPQGNKTYQYQQSSAQLYGLEAVVNLQPERMKGFTINNAISLIYWL
jgi:iron complex outermembrane receptor protein